MRDAPPHDPSDDAERNDAAVRLGIGLLVSLALHLAVLDLSAPGLFRLWAPGGQTPASPLTVAFVQAAAGAASSMPRLAVDESAPALILSQTLDAASPAAATAPETAREPEAAASATASTRPSVAPPPSGPIPGPWYFPARLLHIRASPTRPVSPAYPPEFQQLAGRVRLVLRLNEKGGIDDYRIAGSSPPGIFDRSVIDAFTRVPYSPGFITGYAVRSEFVVEVTFEPGTAPTVSMPDPGR